MVAWIAKVQEGDFIGGISAMNDMLEMYPKDKHLLYLAGNWLLIENADDQAHRQDNQRLEQRRKAPDSGAGVGIVDIGHPDEHGIQPARLFTDAQQMRRQRRELARATHGRRSWRSISTARSIAAAR